ncbi:MAG: hypothetical protein WDN28_03605 [Chthoniobacter sp.]
MPQCPHAQCRQGGAEPGGHPRGTPFHAADDKFDAALKLARAIALQRGQIADAELQNARSAGLNDAEIVEIIQHVALNTLTNYTNNVARTVLDFPEVKPGELEPARAAA